MNLHTARLRWSSALTVALLFAGCAGNHDSSSPSESNDAGASSAKAQRVRAMNQVTDHHSYARPAEARITHLNWNASVDFDSRTIQGVATYDIETAEDAQRIVFDTHDLTIRGSMQLFDAPLRDDGNAFCLQCGAQPVDQFTARARGQAMHAPP